VAAALARDALAPPRPGGTLPGALMSLLAHAALVAALAYGVNWRAPAADTVSAELWAAVPQAAAPPPPPAVQTEPAPRPPPTPREVQPAPPPPKPALPDPQIAIEKARKEKLEKAREEQLERDRLEREKAAKAEKAEKARADQEKAERDKAQRDKAAAEARTAQQREENLRRMMGQLGGAASAAGTRGSAAADAAPSASYAGKLRKAIKENIILPTTLAGNPAAEVEVRAAPSGTVLGRTLVKSSGNKEWDDEVLRAIDRTATLPRDTDGRVPPVLIITFRPQD
jgi:colicin import membrane protein